MKEMARCNHNLYPKVTGDRISSSLLWLGYNCFCLFQISKDDDKSCSPTIRPAVSDWSVEKYEYYMDRHLFQKDPFVREAGAAREIFIVYDDLRKRPLEIPFAEFCEIFDIRLGFAYCIETDGDQYIFCAHGQSPSSKQTVTEEAAKIIATYCWSGMALYSFNSNSAKAPQKSKLLTRRQKDCLHWASLGKSDWEIGKVLGLSHHTVHRHIEAAKHRLEVSTRVQAIRALDIML